MNVQQSYFDFLQEQGAKEKIKSVIRKGYRQNERCKGTISIRLSKFYSKNVGQIFPR